MEKIDRYKILVRHLVKQGVASSQKDLAQKMGYKNESSFSQIINGKVNEPKDFIEKFVSYIPDLNRDWLLYGEGEMLKSEAVQPTQEVDENTTGVIPVVPISAMGGALTGFDPTISITDCEMMISPISDAELAIGVYGDSMAPEYPNGSRVLIKKIDMTAFIEWGKAYVLSTTNGSIVKVVYPADEKSVECRSLNPAYPPFTVKYKDIHAMYKVLMCMSLK